VTRPASHDKMGRVVRKKGRRPGKQDTRETILNAAREVFAEEGYDKASIRRIAADAGVDPALVHHYFGTKEQLFQAVIQVPLDPGAVLPTVFAGDRETLPQRILRTFMDTWENPVSGQAFRALVASAATNKVSARLVREFFSRQIQRRLRTLAADHGVAESEIGLRSTLVASQMLGLAFARYIAELQPLASLPRDEVVALVAPTIERYLFGELA